MIALTRSWALELAETGITVNAIAPGTIETKMFHEKVLPGSEEEQLYSSMIPMGRFGQPSKHYFTSGRTTRKIIRFFKSA